MLNNMEHNQINNSLITEEEEYPRVQQPDDPNHNSGQPLNE